MMNLVDRIPNILLLGAGPNGVAPSTYQALSCHTIGHLDPYFIKIMDGLKENLRQLMNTKNELTVPLSGTGSLGMETAFVNLAEHGDKVLVLQNGVFGTRMIDVARRLGAEVTELSYEWGTPVDVDQVAAQLKKDQYKIVAVIMAETSTGVRNPVEKIGALLKGSDSLYLVDTVTALGGIPVKVDEWGIDICYAGAQKCLSCPPGASPITFSDRAVQMIHKRKTPVPNWYVDMGLLTKYWGGENARVYHHTPPINMMYGLYQATYNILEEGADNVFARHQKAHERLVQRVNGLDGGWGMLVEKEYCLPMLNAVTVPVGINEASIRARLLKDYKIEVSSGLGSLAGKIIRIGLMGYNAQDSNADLVMDAIEEILKG